MRKSQFWGMAAVCLFLAAGAIVVFMLQRLPPQTPEARGADAGAAPALSGEKGAAVHSGSLGSSAGEPLDAQESHPQAAGASQGEQPANAPAGDDKPASARSLAARNETAGETTKSASAGKYPPLSDPDPAQTRQVMERLLRNYDNVHTLEFAVDMEFEGEDAARLNGTRKVRLTIPPEAKTYGEPAPESLGMARLFAGRMEIEQRSGSVEMKGTLENGVFEFSVRDASSSMADAESVSQESMLGRQEGFDSVFFFHYVTWQPAGVTQQQLDSLHFLKAHRSKLQVDKATGRIMSALAYDTRGRIELKQEFLEYYDFAEHGFVFPKTIRVSAYDKGNLDRARRCVYRVRDVRINQGAGGAGGGT